MIANAVKELQQRKNQIASQVRSLEAEAKQLDQAIKVLSKLSGPVAVKAKAAKRKMSAATIAKMRVAAKARWAKRKNKVVAAVKPAKKKRKMSAAAKAKLSAFQKARWAKIKAAKKK
jgi:hypothetical protein